MKRTTVFIFFMIIALGFMTCSPDQTPKTLSGLDVITSQGCALLEGKNVGIVTNHTAYNAKGEHISDIVHNMEEMTLTAIFAPEHGFRGTAEAGEYITEGIDSATGARIYSIYGSTRKPTPEMLTGLDILVFDIQDVGARFYTYISTMGNVMEAGAENGIPVVILDRPNPLGGWVEGPVLDMTWQSFVGMYPIPVRHGLTVGELAQMIKGEGWINAAESPDLTVIPMKNWQPDMVWEETGMTWIDPSPNIGGMNPAVLYPGLCLLEATNVSEGRGTDHAFEWIGADYIDGEELAEALKALNIKGVDVKPVSFTPVDIPGKATNPKYENKEIEGVALRVTDRKAFKSVTFGVALLNTLNYLYPEDFQVSRPEWLNRLWGNESLNDALKMNVPTKDIMQAVQNDVDAFSTLKEKYSLYR